MCIFFRVNVLLKHSFSLFVLYYFSSFSAVVQCAFDDVPYASSAFVCFSMKVYILYIFCYLRYFGTQILS